MGSLSEVYTPHINQVPIHASKAKSKVFEMARRFGKSRSALFEMLDCYLESLSIPVTRDLQPPFHAWIITPSFPQSGQVWTELAAFIPDEWVARRLEEQKQIWLKGDVNGNRGYGLIEIKSAHDPENLQTAGLDFTWVTESQDISNRAFEKMKPMLISPGRMGRVVYEGIPSLYNEHWFWKICDYAQTERARANDGYAYFHGTAYQNPMLTEDQLAEIEEDRLLLTDAAWRRLYLAERSESAGFFKNIDACTAGDLLPGPLPGGNYVAGLDLGRKHDASVLWIFDRSTRRALYHDRWDAGEDWAVQREGVVAACLSWNVESLKIDATGMGGDIFYQWLSEAGLPVEEYIFNEASRLEMLNNLAVAMERETVSFPYEEHLARELRAFQFLRRGGGRPRPDHPEGEHDDEIFALGLGLLCCDEGIPGAMQAGVGGAMSYFPASANGMTHSRGATMMADRRQTRMDERNQRSGVEVA